MSWAHTRPFVAGLIAVAAVTFSFAGRAHAGAVRMESAQGIKIQRCRKAVPPPTGMPVPGYWIGTYLRGILLPDFATKE